MSDNKIQAVGVNIAEKATIIWNVADMLRGPFKPHEYGLVILPMTVVKRFHDCLLPTHEAVLAQYEKVKKLAVIDGFLTKASGYQFYNTSKFTFDKLLADPDNVEANFRDYLAGFSPNVQDVLSKFDFDNIIKRMVESNTLYLVIKEFNTPKGYLGPDKISAVDCGYIFEDLVKRFSESFGEEAGAHFTSRDIIYLMTDLLLSDADLSETQNVTVYDMTMGTSQMLSCMEERIHDLNEDIEVTCFGQEFNPSTFAIAKADMMIRGGDPNNMRFGDTLSDDQFGGYTFQYIISNPPFGIDWKREQKEVEKEAAKGELGRFAPGLPKISDGQQLFVLNGLSKLAPTGKMAIIQNGSPLFAGDAGSGPSNIRQYILENDWLDCIIQLSPDQFMNAEISTYIWVISKDKPTYRAGKVQLIDASQCYVQRRKAIGQKKNDITDECREMIVKAYGEYRDAIYEDENGLRCESKVFESVEFGFHKVVIEQPKRTKSGQIERKAGKPIPDKDLRSIEIIPLTEDIDNYFEREVRSKLPDAWIDHTKTKVGYEIVFGKLFYKPAMFRKASELLEEIHALEAKELELTTYISSIFRERKDACVRRESDYRETGIEWFPVIPVTWDLVKGKYVLELQKRPIKPDDGVITCFRDGEVTLRSNRREDGFTFADKEIGYQGIEIGDLVIHGMDGFAGAIGISDSRGKGSPVLNVCTVKDGYDITYVMWYLRYLAYQNVFMATATGIRERSCDLRWSSIGVQFKQCAEYAKKELRLDDDFTFMEYEDKGLSGYFSDRPDFQRMLRDVQDGKIRAIVCYKLDRVGRKTTDLLRLMDFLEKYNVDLLICSNGINTASGFSKIFIQIFAVIAEFERDTLTERITDNMMELAKDGRWLGGNTPMGFTAQRVTTGSGKGKSAYSYLVSIPEEKKMVQRLYTLFRTNRSIQKTAKQMNLEGYRTPSGAEFNASTTRLVLRNPIYCTADRRSYDYFIDHEGNVFGDLLDFDGQHGLSAYNKTDQEKFEDSDSTFISPKFVQAVESKPISEWIIAVGKHEGFISSEHWIETQELLDAIAEKYNRPHRKTNALLAGLIHCPCCGKRLNVISESDRWTNGKPRFKYVCPGYRKKTCNFKAVDGVLLDEFIVQQLSDMSDEDSERFKEILEIKIEEVLEQSSTTQEYALLKKKREKLQTDIVAQTRNMREVDESIRCYLQDDIQAMSEELRETERMLFKLEESRKNGMVAIRDLEQTKERLLSFAEYAKDAQPEVLVTLIQTIVERIYIVDKDDERFCHIFIKGCTDEDYTGFFQTAGYIEQKTTPVCDSEQYCICAKVQKARNIWKNKSRYRTDIEEIV